MDVLIYVHMGIAYRTGCKLHMSWAGALQSRDSTPPLANVSAWVKRWYKQGREWLHAWECVWCAPERDPLCKTFIHRTLHHMAQTAGRGVSDTPEDVDFVEFASDREARASQYLMEQKDATGNWVWPEMLTMSCPKCGVQQVACRKYCTRCEAEFIYVTFSPTTHAREIAPKGAPAAVLLAVNQRNEARVVLSQQLSANVKR